MANTKISALTANTNPTGLEEFVYAYNNANGKITLDTMKTFVGGAGITTLNADANIWELNEGTYVTTHDLYYKTGEKVPVYTATGSTHKQMLFVTKESTGEIGFFVYNVGHLNATCRGRASYGYSVSSSVGYCSQLGEWDASLEHYSYIVGAASATPDSLSKDTLTQVLENITGSNTNEIAISSQNPPYVGATYTIIVNSVTDAYSITLGTGVTNPLGITLPNNVNKKCVITLIPTSTTTAIVTGCTIES